MERRTRILATVGPATRGPERPAELIRAGVDVFRINCSHASHQDIRREVARIRRAASDLGRPVGILLDLQGPKIRTGPLPEPLELADGSLLTILMAEAPPGTGPSPEGGVVGTTWPHLARDVRGGDRVIFADGALEGRVEAVEPGAVRVRILHGGLLGSHKGINLPGSEISAPAMTAKDEEDLAVGVGAGVDFVALSFVRRGEEVRALRERLVGLERRDLPIIAKIEKPQAVADIAAILRHADGVMVARGDLGVETPLEELPLLQKQLVRAANRVGRLCIIATQMLDSMERNPRPTRAEATDVANAILDGADAVMLSGETATGEHPIEAVRFMDRLARAAESSAFYRRPGPEDLPEPTHASDTVLQAACEAAHASGRPLVVFTWSGRTALEVSKRRPGVPIYALAPSEAVRDRLALAWGVTPLTVPPVADTDGLIEAADRRLLQQGHLQAGDEVVVVAGRLLAPGATNMMKIHRVGEQEVA